MHLIYLVLYTTSIKDVVHKLVEDLLSNVYEINHPNLVDYALFRKVLMFRYGKYHDFREFHFEITAK